MSLMPLASKGISANFRDFALGPLRRESVSLRRTLVTLTVATKEMVSVRDGALGGAWLLSSDREGGGFERLTGG